MRIFFSILLLVIFWGQLGTTAPLTFPVRIAVLDTGKNNSHEQQVVNVLKGLLQNCPHCAVKTYPIYLPNGDLTQDSFLTALKQADKDADLIHLSWNINSSEKTLEIEKALRELAQRKIVVAAAGAPEDGSLNKKIETTVMGNASGVFIVGELGDKGHLKLDSYYGSKLFSAFKLPAQGNSGNHGNLANQGNHGNSGNQGNLANRANGNNYRNLTGSSFSGSSFSSLILTAAIAKRLSNLGVSKSLELKKDLIERKQKSFLPFPDLKILGL